MAYPVSLATLVQRVRQRANFENANSFLPDVELIDDINQSIAKWYDEVRGTTWGGQYFRSQFPFFTAPGTTNQVPFVNPPPGSYYPLPPDFLSVTSVDVAISPSTFIITCKAMPEERRNAYRVWPVGWLFNTTVYYQIWGQNIVFFPVPEAAYQVQLNYVPVAPQLTGPNSTLDSINGWEEFVVLDAAIKVLIKDRQGDMVAILQGRLEEERQRIRAMAPRRDMNQAEGVHEIETYDDFSYSGL